MRNRSASFEKIYAHKARERERERVIPFFPKTTQRRREKNTKERERERARYLRTKLHTPLTTNP